MNAERREKIFKYLQEQHLAIVAAVISVSSLGLQLAMDWPQFSLLQFQGESVGLSLSRDHMNDHNGPRYIAFATDPAIDTVWDGEIDNTSTQAPLTISKWRVYAKTTSGYHEVEGSDYSELSYTPFSKPSGEPIPLPITLPPGSTLQFRVMIPIGISQKAAPDLYKYQGEHLDLTTAAQLYSWSTGQNGKPKDIFGNDAIDGNGYSLSVPKDELKKLIFPVMRLELQSTRGKTYSAISPWYKEIYTWSKEDWDKANHEMVAHRNDPVP